MLSGSEFKTYRALISDRKMKRLLSSDALNSLSQKMSEVSMIYARLCLEYSDLNSFIAEKKIEYGKSKAVGDFNVRPGLNSRDALSKAKADALETYGYILGDVAGLKSGLSSLKIAIKSRIDTLRDELRHGLVNN